MSTEYIEGIKRAIEICNEVHSFYPVNVFLPPTKDSCVDAYTAAGCRHASELIKKHLHQEMDKLGYLEDNE
jgi:hypothetical protein